MFEIEEVEKGKGLYEDLHRHAEDTWRHAETKDHFLNKIERSL